MTVEVRHTSGDPQSLELASLTALALRCEAREDPPGIDGRIVRVSVDGHVVASLELGSVPRDGAWITRMAASLARSVTGASAGFGGQGTVEALHGAHGVGRYDADRIAGARREARLRDRRRRTEASGLPVPATTGDDATAADDGGK